MAWVMAAVSVLTANYIPSSKVSVRTVERKKEIGSRWTKETNRMTEQLGDRCRNCGQLAEARKALEKTSVYFDEATEFMPLVAKALLSKKIK